MSKNHDLNDIIADRLKKSQIGDLIKEEDLYDITKMAIQKAFFTERVDPSSSSYNTRYLKPIIVEAAEQFLKEQAGEVIKVWLKSQPEEWQTQTRDALDKMLKDLTPNKVATMIFQTLIGSALNEFSSKVSMDTRMLIGEALRNPSMYT